MPNLENVFIILYFGAKVVGTYENRWILTDRVLRSIIFYEKTLIRLLRRLEISTNLSNFIIQALEQIHVCFLPNNVIRNRFGFIVRLIINLNQ